MRKVKLEVMKPWIAKKVSELLGFEDEVVIEYVNGLLEDVGNPVSFDISIERFYKAHSNGILGRRRQENANCTDRLSGE